MESQGFKSNQNCQDSLNGPWSSKSWPTSGHPIVGRIRRIYKLIPGWSQNLGVYPPSLLYPHPGPAHPGLCRPARGLHCVSQTHLNMCLHLSPGLQIPILAGWLDLMGTVCIEMFPPMGFSPFPNLPVSTYALLVCSVHFLVQACACQSHLSGHQPKGSFYMTSHLVKWAF